MSEEIRRKIRELRKEKGLRAEDMAKGMGISRPFYTQLEGGKRRLSVDYIGKIARLLGVSVGELFGETRPHRKDIPKNSKHIKPINVPALRRRLAPLLEEDVDEVMNCIQLWVIAPGEVRHSLEESVKKKPEDKQD